MTEQRGLSVGAMPDNWSLPEITARNEAWFTSGTLAVQRCTACSVRQHPPEELCHACGGTRFSYDAVAPRGTIFSYTVAHYAVNRALADAVPYAVVLVSLDDAPDVRVIGNLPGVPLEEVRIGVPVVAHWEESTADDGTVVRLPQWQPA